MLIEQLLNWNCGPQPSPPSPTCSPKTGYFYEKKTKISKENLRLNYYLLLKILQKAMNFASLHLNQVNHRIYPINARF